MAVQSGSVESEAELSHLGERFYRLLGSAQPGSGLGWSIVTRIGHVFGVTLQTGRSSRLGGFAVTMYWTATK